MLCWIRTKVYPSHLPVSHSDLPDGSRKPTNRIVVSVTGIQWRKAYELGGWLASVYLGRQWKSVPLGGEVNAAGYRIFNSTGQRPAEIMSALVSGMPSKRDRNGRACAQPQRRFSLASIPNAHLMWAECSRELLLNFLIGGLVHTGENGPSGNLS